MHGINHLDLDRIDGCILRQDSGFYVPRYSRRLIKAMLALTRYAAAGIEDTGLGDSDFRVVEVLLYKGPLPVNALGPIVDLTPGPIGIAVDRLVEKGLVSRVESTEDRRVRIVTLTPRGKDLIVPAFRSIPRR